MDDLATSEGATPVPREFPPVVYVPCAEEVQDPADARPVLRRARDGRLTLLAYSALDRLHDGCGYGQPWVLLPLDALDEVQRTQGVEMILLDVNIPVEYRYQPEG